MIREAIFIEETSIVQKVDRTFVKSLDYTISIYRLSRTSRITSHYLITLMVQLFNNIIRSCTSICIIYIQFCEIFLTATPKRSKMWNVAPDASRDVNSGPVAARVASRSLVHSGIHSERAINRRQERRDMRTNWISRAPFRESPNFIALDNRPLGKEEFTGRRRCSMHSEWKLPCAQQIRQTRRMLKVSEVV